MLVIKLKAVFVTERMFTRENLKNPIQIKCCNVMYGNLINLIINRHY